MMNSGFKKFRGLRYAVAFAGGIGLFLSSASCQKVGSAGTSPNDSTNYLKVIIQSQEDGVSSGSAGVLPAVVSQQTCSVLSSASAATAPNCAVTLPQGTLWHSSLIFTISTDAPSTCDSLVFTPYVYQAGNAANFTSEWTTSATDCTASPTPLACFSGGGIAILTGYPLQKSISQATASSATMKFTIPSAQSSGRLSNRWTTNTLDLALRSGNRSGALATPPVLDDYVASSMQDWSVSCLDVYNKVIYTIPITVTSALNSTGTADANDPSINAHPSWTGTLAPQATGAAGSSAPFTVTVSTSPENATTPVTLQSTCTVPGGTALGTTVNCTSAIPEGTLHFSSVIMSMSSLKATCTRMKFIPYFYIANNSSTTYQAEWNTGPVDCTVASTASVAGFGGLVPSNTGCYNGPAPSLVPTFPLFQHLYILTAVSLSATFTIPSANTSQRHSNRWTSNSLTSRTANLLGSNASPPVQDDYLANSMQDYQFQCVDAYDQLVYGIKLVLSDVDTGAGGGTNVWPDWNTTQDPH